MVLLSGSTLALMTLLIAGAAAAKDPDRGTVQRTTGGTQISAAERDIGGDEAAAAAVQNRRTKRGRTNEASSEEEEEEEEPFWAARGRRAHLQQQGSRSAEGQLAAESALPYGLGWIFPQKRAVGSSEEDEAPFWASRGRRCCSQAKEEDLKRSSYGKDRVRALLARIIAGGGAEAVDLSGENDVFWAARGKRRHGDAEQYEDRRPRL